jgi:hypothetical protein
MNTEMASKGVNDTLGGHLRVPPLDLLFIVPSTRLHPTNLSNEKQRRIKFLIYRMSEMKKLFSYYSFLVSLSIVFFVFQKKCLKNFFGEYKMLI